MNSDNMGKNAEIVLTEKKNKLKELSSCQRLSFNPVSHFKNTNCVSGVFIWMMLNEPYDGVPLNYQISGSPVHFPLRSIKSLSELKKVEVKKYDQCLRERFLTSYFWDDQMQFRFVLLLHQKPILPNLGLVHAESKSNNKMGIYFLNAKDAYLPPLPRAPGVVSRARL